MRVSGFAPLIAFVEGRLPSADFAEWLYHDAQAETLLCAEESIPPYTREALNLYLYLIERDFGSTADMLNAQDAISQFLKKRDIPHETVWAFADAHDALLKAVPRWLSLPPAYAQKLMLEAESKTRQETTTRLKARIAERFRYLKVPPKWLQAPDWLFADDRPLLFVGQLDISGLSHDTAALYVFYDLERDEYAFTKQTT